MSHASRQSLHDRRVLSYSLAVPEPEAESETTELALLMRLLLMVVALCISVCRETHIQNVSCFVLFSP